MGKILFFNDESQKIFKQRRKQNKGKKTTDNSITSLSEDILKMMEMVDKGATYEEIQGEIDSRKFAIVYWMKLYDTAKSSKARREAFLNLRRLMLVTTDNNLLSD